MSRSTPKLDIRLSVARAFNAAKHGKTRKSPADRPLSPRISGIKRRSETTTLASHIWTPCAVVTSKAQLKNSTRNMCFRGTKFCEKTTTPHENLLSTAARQGADTNKKHNNQPYKRFNTHLGRVSLHFWLDWAAVALLVSYLVSGPFLRLWTLVDCYELHFLVQK